MMKIPTETTTEIELAARINRAFEETKFGFRKSIEQAIECGELLTEAKELVTHGDWIKWLGANTDISPRTAQKLMQLARNRDVILSIAPDPGYLAIDAALGFVAKKKTGSKTKGHAESNICRLSSLRKSPSFFTGDPQATAALESDINQTHLRYQASMVFWAVKEIWDGNPAPHQVAAEIRMHQRQEPRRRDKGGLSKVPVEIMVDAVIVWLQNLSKALKQSKNVKSALRIVPREEE